MKRNKPSKRDLAALCAEVRPDDGIDPKQFFRTETTRRKNDRKTMQLCSQVADTLNQFLSGESGDDVLRELQVVSVVPAPDASQLLVVVAPLLNGGPTEGIALARLDEASGRLRAAVTGAITRRRAPKLLFQFVAGSPGARRQEAGQ